MSTTALAVVIGSGIVAVGTVNAVRACRPGQPIRLAANACKANPCAAKRKCNPCAGKKSCNPCGAKTGYNPCAAKKGCRPRAAKRGCNPCGASNPCNPCRAAGIATECVIPRLAAAHRGANPSAAKKACNPCAAKKACDPCNPCGVGGKEPPALSDAEAVAAYDCVGPHMAKAYAKSGRPAARAYRKWRRFSKVSYPAEAHGVRFMNNYANKIARDDYGKWEAAGAMPVGSVLAKDSFIVGENGGIAVGPLFVMTKGSVGANAEMRDWTYTLIMPSGSVREDAATQIFCNNCHRRAGAADDNLMFLPLPFRVTVGK